MGGYSAPELVGTAVVIRVSAVRAVSMQTCSSWDGFQACSASGIPELGYESSAPELVGTAVVIRVSAVRAVSVQTCSSWAGFQACSASGSPELGYESR
ncbi:hypothetical protein NDU88_007280 [Pleurodeles waltl]|uniref:Uncharacterized protein n=1 Tax=Pleurodeles waltl TaxID=8319 RepID=A0AAV7VPA1_PLEWA|nr:hypothetical protein NDU88_007280 [Pleurodeles waltl]